MQVFPDKAAERSVLSLLVHCTYANENCTWEGELRDLQVRAYFEYLCNNSWSKELF